MDNSIAIICSNRSNGADPMQRALVVSVEMVRPLVSGYLVESISRSFLCATRSSCSRQRSFKRRYLSMTRSPRHEFPRNFGFKAMIDAVHIGHTTTNPVMAENTTDLGVASESSPAKASKPNILKVVAKKLKREGSRIRFIPFRSSSDRWISFRDYESRVDGHQTKSEPNIQVESVTPYSEARESVHRICFDESRLDQLPILKRGHVRKIVASLEVQLRRPQVAGQTLTVKDISAADSEQDMERAMGYREEEEGSNGAKVPKDVVQDISSFRPLHFSGNFPKSESSLDFQKPVAVVKPARDLSAGPMNSIHMGSRDGGEEDMNAAALPHGFEKYTPDMETGQEVDAKDAPSETQGIGSGSNTKKISVGKNTRPTTRHRRRLHFMNRDKRDKPLEEKKSNDVGDTSEMRRFTADGSGRQGENRDKGSEEVMATETKISSLNNPDRLELQNTARPIELDLETPQRLTATQLMTNVTADQDAPRKDEGQMSTTATPRSNGRNRRRKERLLELFSPAFYRG